MKNKLKKRSKVKPLSRREFFELVADGAKLVAVGAIASEVVEYIPSMKAERPDLLAGGKGDYEGV